MNLDEIIDQAWDLLEKKIDSDKELAERKNQILIRQAAESEKTKRMELSSKEKIQSLINEGLLSRQQLENEGLLSRQQLANAGIIEQERISNKAAMQRSLLDTNVQRRGQDLQYGEKGFYNRKLGFNQDMAEKQYNLKRAAMRAPQYHYMKTKSVNAEGGETETPIVFRNGLPYTGEEEPEPKPKPEPKPNGEEGDGMGRQIIDRLQNPLTMNSQNNKRSFIQNNGSIVSGSSLLRDNDSQRKNWRSDLSLNWA